jgi:NTP pyrophosphatase (non-canonical NTP hydrolase)
MGELADAHAKNDIPEKKDAVGDILVCLVNYCKLEGLDLTQCCESAWNEIKDRKGHMIEGGVFVKE